MIDLELRYNNIFFISKIEDETTVSLFKMIVLDIIKEIHSSKLSFIKYPIIKDEYRKLFDEIMQNYKDLFLQKLAESVNNLFTSLKNSNIIIYKNMKYIIEENVRKQLLSLISSKNLFLKIFDYLIYPFSKIKKDDKLKLS